MEEDFHVKQVNLLKTATELPRFVIGQVLRPLRLSLRSPGEHPSTQAQFAALVSRSVRQQVRAGYTHRFIDLMFVTVGERVFCRRYTYNEPSWHSAFLTDAEGQVRLDKTVVNIEARVPADMDEIVPAVDAAYAASLKKLGASFLLSGATDDRAQASTLELSLASAPEPGTPADTTQEKE